MKFKKLKNENPSSTSNHTTDTTYLKNVRAFAGKTTCNIGKWTTIWRDLNIKSIYSTHPDPAMFKNIPKSKTTNINLLVYPPEVFKDYV